MKKHFLLLACLWLGSLVVTAGEPLPSFSFFGRLQMDGAIYSGADYQSLGNGVGFRRARVGTDFVLNDQLSGRAEIDFTDGGFSVKDCYVKYIPIKNFALRAGSMKENISMEAMTSSVDPLFMEHPVVTSVFSPEFHLGVQGAWSQPRYRLEGGVFFKKINALKEKEYSESNSKLGIDEGVSYTARGVWMPLSADKTKGLHIGMAASYRTPKTTTAANSPKMVRYTGYSFSYISKIRFLDTGPVPSVDHDWLVGAEVGGFYRGFRFQGEYMQNQTVRTGALPTEEFHGYYLQAGYLLFGGQQKYSTSRGAFSTPTTGRNWGDLEVALRYEKTDLNGDLIRGGSVEGWSMGINYYATHNLKLQLNYSYVDHDKYANAFGQAAVGYKSNGELAYQAADVDEAKGKGGNSYGILALRLQVSF